MKLNSTIYFFIVLLVASASELSPQIQDLFHRNLKQNQSCTEDCCNLLPSRQPMTYIFYQNTGRFIGGSGQHAVNTLTYSGQGAGYLNPDMQCVFNTGPLPASIYSLGYCKNIMHETVPRPCSFYLDPLHPEEICGRSDFFIHGCTCCTPGDDTNPPSPGCSAGCIVLSYINRKKLRVGDTLIVRHYEPKMLNLQKWDSSNQQLIQKIIDQKEIMNKMTEQ